MTYLKKEVLKSTTPFTDKQIAYFLKFKDNLLKGIDYYKELIPRMLAQTKEYREKTLDELFELKVQLEDFVHENWAAFNLENKLTTN